MTGAVVLPFPLYRTQEVTSAREAIARPDLHTEAELREACAVLAARGDWIDVEQATRLRLALDEHALQRNRKRARGNRILHRAILALLILNLALFATAAGVRHWADARNHGGPGHAAQR